MQSYTVDEMMAFRPRYSREQVADLWAGRERLSLLEILDLDIPAADRIWGTTRSGDHLPAFAAMVAARAVRNHCLSCGIPVVETWAAKWLSGADRTAEAAASAWWAEAAAEAAAEAGCVWEAAEWVAENAAEEDENATEAERELQIEDMKTAIARHN